MGTTYKNVSKRVKAIYHRPSPVTSNTLWDAYLASKPGSEKARQLMDQLRGRSNVDDRQRALTSAPSQPENPEFTDRETEQDDSQFDD